MGIGRSLIPPRITFNNPDHGRVVARRAGTFFNPECDRCVSVVVGGELIGGVTYQGYTGTSIQMHMAGMADRWATRDFMWVIFDYPFNQLGVERVFGQLVESNTRALEIVEKLGFKRVARVEGVFPTGACIVSTMERADCRWLKIKPRGLSARPEA